MCPQPYREIPLQTSLLFWVQKTTKFGTCEELPKFLNKKIYNDFLYIDKPTSSIWPLIVVLGYQVIHFDRAEAEVVRHHAREHAWHPCDGSVLCRTLMETGVLQHSRKLPTYDRIGIMLHSHFPRSTPSHFASQSVSLLASLTNPSCQWWNPIFYYIIAWICFFSREEGYPFVVPMVSMKPSMVVALLWSGWFSDKQKPECEKNAYSFMGLHCNF